MHGHKSTPRSINHSSRLVERQMLYITNDVSWLNENSLLVVGMIAAVGLRENYRGYSGNRPAHTLSLLRVFLFMLTTEQNAEVIQG